MTPLSLRISVRLALRLAKAEFSSPTDVTTTASVKTVVVSLVFVFSFNNISLWLFDYWFNHYKLAFAGL